MAKIILVLLLFAFFTAIHKLLRSKSHSERLLKVLFVYVFIFGALEYLGLPDFLRKFLIDILIFFLLVLQVQKKNYKIPGLKFFLIFTIILIFSAIFNSSAIYPTFTYYRTFLYPYIIFLAIYNLKMDQLRWQSFTKFIFSLFILQIFASVFKLIFIGIDEKVLVGTVSTLGGTYSTIVPLAAIAFVISFLLYEKQSLRKYIILIFGFLIMGFVGAKRGIWFYVPLTFLIAAFSYSKIAGRKLLSKSRINVVILIIAFSGIVIYLGAKYSPTLNPNKTFGGNVDMDYLKNYAVEYTFAQSNYEKTSQGRGANTLTIFKDLSNSNLVNILFGYGPEAGKGVGTYGEGIWGELGINGPITGLSYHLVQLGILFIILITLLSYRLSQVFYKYTIIEHDLYWKIMNFGAFLVTIVFILDFFTYSSSFINSIFPLSFSFAYFSAIIFKRNKIRFESVT